MAEFDTSGVLAAAKDLLQCLRDYEDAAWSADGVFDGIEPITMLTDASLDHARLERELAALGCGGPDSKYPFPAAGRPMPSRFAPALQRLWRITIEIRDGADELKDSLLLGWIADGKPPRLGQFVSMLEGAVDTLRKREAEKNGSGSSRRNAARHSIDFRSINWFGTPHNFTASQAACVRVLWNAWENETPGVGEAAIQEAADVSSAMRSLFDSHPAWGTLIISPSKGSYSLKAPDQQKTTES